MFLGQIIVEAIQTDREREYERAARERRMLVADDNLPPISSAPAVEMTSKTRSSTSETRGRSANAPA